MRKLSVFRILAVVGIILIASVVYFGHQDISNDLAGDDLPINIGKSIPRV